MIKVVSEEPRTMMVDGGLTLPRIKTQAQLKKKYSSALKPDFLPYQNSSLDSIQSVGQNNLVVDLNSSI